MMLLSRLRRWLRDYFSFVVYEAKPSVEAAGEGPLVSRRRRGRRRVVAPSERFVWAMILLIVALIGLIMLEAIYILVVRQISDELVAGISAVMASLATAFLMGKRSA